MDSQNPSTDQRRLFSSECIGDGAESVDLVVDFLVQRLEYLLGVAEGEGVSLALDGPIEQGQGLGVSLAPSVAVLAGLLHGPFTIAAYLPDLL